MATRIWRRDKPGLRRVTRASSRRRSSPAKRRPLRATWTIGRAACESTRAASSTKSASAHSPRWPFAGYAANGRPPYHGPIPWSANLQSGEFDALAFLAPISIWREKRKPAFLKGRRARDAQGSPAHTRRTVRVILAHLSPPCRKRRGPQGMGTATAVRGSRPADARDAGVAARHGPVAARRRRLYSTSEHVAEAGAVG